MPRRMIRAELPMPPTTNNAYASVWVKGKMRRVKTAKSSNYAYQVATYLWSQGYLAGCAKGWDGPVAVEATFWFGRRGKVDLANREKIMMDAVCKHIGIDDSRITLLLMRKGYDKDRPRCELDIGVFSGGASVEWEDWR